MVLGILFKTCYLFLAGVYLVSASIPLTLITPLSSMCHLSWQYRFTMLIKAIIQYNESVSECHQSCIKMLSHADNAATH